MPSPVPPFGSRSAWGRLLLVAMGFVLALPVACGKPETYSRPGEDAGQRDMGATGSGGGILPGTGGTGTGGAGTGGTGTGGTGTGGVIMGTGGAGTGGSGTGGAGGAGTGGAGTGGLGAGGTATGTGGAGTGGMGSGGSGPGGMGSGGAGPGGMGSGGAGPGGMGSGGAGTGGTATGGMGTGGAGTGGTGTGGMATGGAGTGGAGGSALSCASPVAPTGGTVTNFADWNATTRKFGTAGGIVGTTFSYAGTGSTATVVVDTTAQNLHWTGMIAAGNYAGMGLSFDVCATGAAYNAVQFTISGSPGGCALELQVQTYSDKSASTGGGCASACSLPTKTNLSLSPSLVTVPFADLTGGTPNPFSAVEIIGLQWQLTVPPPSGGGAQNPCTVDLRLDDVRFVMQ